MFSPEHPSLAQICHLACNESARDTWREETKTWCFKKMSCEIFVYFTQESVNALKKKK